MVCTSFSVHDGQIWDVNVCVGNVTIIQGPNSSERIMAEDSDRHSSSPKLVGRGRNNKKISKRPYNGRRSLLNSEPGQVCHRKLLYRKFFYLCRINKFSGTRESLTSPSTNSIPASKTVTSCLISLSDSSFIYLFKNADSLR